MTHFSSIDTEQEREAELAREASRVLSARLSTADPPQVRLPGKYAEERVCLPARAARLLVRILSEMAKGNNLMLVPVQSELTTQEAADILNISRPSLIQILTDGKIPFRKVGTHRRVLWQDVESYKTSVEAGRRASHERPSHRWDSVESHSHAVSAR
jgi:excisionase family DNA binding protein